ncbi:2'-5' RNA ligase family protein [Flavobacterium pectinovorum]|uniref:2'-5' RNA ligase family protein n=1 Tax=Flavobacterium pectinovorum TaxID=29533 RepID=UPI001FAD27E7|nr:mutarotase [Flavobacterium pectinovorum]MCI9844531.1 mutarotase [Flavobacterium pectinovorum]
MNLSEHYNALFKKSSELILSENYTIDSKISDDSDKRFGLTLLVRPNNEIKANIQSFLKELKKTEPNQYYYPNSDIHITIMSIISCYEGFSLDKFNMSEYVEIIEKSLVDVNEIEIDYQGITLSPSAVMIQGFPSDNSLNVLRDKLRDNFKNSSLTQSIDSRYSIVTAHSTVMRFQKKLENPKKLIEVIEKFRTHNFGKFTAEKIELVFNDWYQRERKTTTLCDLYLKFF